MSASSPATAWASAGCSNTRTFTLLVTLATFILTVYLFLIVPKGFFPVQDTGVCSPSPRRPKRSASRHGHAPAAACRVILRDPDVESLSSFIGIDGQNMTLNSGRIQINLRDREKRSTTAVQIVRRLASAVAKVDGIQCFLQPLQDLTVEDRVSKTQYQYSVEDANTAEMTTWSNRLVEKLSQLPTLTDVASDQQLNGLEAHLVIDRDTASRLGITPQNVDDALDDAFGQRQVSTIFTQSNQYHVVLEVAPGFQLNPASLDRVYVKSSNGSQVPLSPSRGWSRARPRSPSTTRASSRRPPSRSISRRQVHRRRGRGRERREGRADPGRAPCRPASTPLPGHRRFVRGLAPERAAAHPRRADRRLHRPRRPLRELHSPHHHPLDAPSAGVGAILALLLFHVDLSVIALIGIILLIGIVKKNAIMMIDFALEAERDQGLSPTEAIYQALPLALSPDHDDDHGRAARRRATGTRHGTGSELRRPLGITIVGGLIVSQVLTLLRHRWSTSSSTGWAAAI